MKMLSENRINYFYCIISGIMFLFVLSCPVPRYAHVYETSKGMDFTRGSWLVNNIDAPWKLQEKLTNNLLDNLKKLGGDSIIFIDKD